MSQSGAFQPGFKRVGPGRSEFNGSYLLLQGGISRPKKKKKVMKKNTKRKGRNIQMDSSEPVPHIENDCYMAFTFK